MLLCVFFLPRGVDAIGLFPSALVCGNFTNGIFGKIFAFFEWEVEVHSHSVVGCGESALCYFVRVVFVSHYSRRW